jgi:hypothetical protein
MNDKHHKKMLLLMEETLWRPFLERISTVLKEQPRNHSRQPPVSRENIQQRCQRKKKVTQRGKGTSRN